MNDNINKVPVMSNMAIDLKETPLGIKVFVSIGILIGLIFVCIGIFTINTWGLLPLIFGLFLIIVHFWILKRNNWTRIIMICFCSLVIFINIFLIWDYFFGISDIESKYVTYGVCLLFLPVGIYSLAFNIFFMRNKIKKWFKDKRLDFSDVQ